MFLETKTGHYVIVSTVGEECKAYIPAPLPPADFNALLSNIDFDLQERANRALGRLDGLSALIPDISLFIYAYIRKEAVLSSQIEGTQSSLLDLLLFEDDQIPGVPLNDVQEVSNYVAAMNHGMKLLSDGLPLSNRLIKEIHKVLLSKGRGSEKGPGEFRRSQNWIGGTRPGNAVHVPPPAEYLSECMGDLEKFINNKPVKTPTLVKAALCHAQFETIHPFLDGNGRVGRLLIALILYSEEALRSPLLYLSLYFKNHRAEYYELLQKIRKEGKWIDWIHFFLAGIKETSEQASETATKILKLFKDDEIKVHKLGRPSGSAMRVHAYLRTKLITSVQSAAKGLDLTEPTVRTSLEHLVRIGIVHEISGRKRDKIFAYGGFIKILNEETKPL